MRRALYLIRVLLVGAILSGVLGAGLFIAGAKWQIITLIMVYCVLIVYVILRPAEPGGE